MDKTETEEEDKNRKEKQMMQEWEKKNKDEEEEERRRRWSSTGLVWTLGQSSQLCCRTPPGGHEADGHLNLPHRLSPTQHSESRNLMNDLLVEIYKDSRLRADCPTITDFMFSPQSGSWSPLRALQTHGKPTQVFSLILPD